MSKKEEIQAITTAIVTAHKGQAYFNFGETGKIIGCGRHTVASVLHEAGITIKKVGPSKRVSAYSIAAAMADGRIAPIDNTSRGIKANT